MKSYRKPYRVKRKKAIWRSRLFRISLLFLIIIGAVSYFLLFSPVFHIKKIIITGDKIFSQENIGALADGKNFFLIDTREIKDYILSSFPQTADVKIRRSLPDVLDISVKKRYPAVLWCESEKCSLADKNGVIFREAADENLMRISGKKEELGKEKIAQILDIQDKLKNIAGVTTTEALIVSKGRINIGISEGWEIYFNTEGDLDWQIKELGLVLEKQISPERRKNLEYVDLRFSRVFYK